MESVFDRLGIRTIINAKGTSTRLSGATLPDEVSAAMREASTACVDMTELQARASEIIASVTGAEAGYVTSGAAAGLLLGTAACVTGLDPGAHQSDEARPGHVGGDPARPRCPRCPGPGHRACAQG